MAGNKVDGRKFSTSLKENWQSSKGNAERGRSGNNALAWHHPERYGISRETMAFYQGVIGPKLKAVIDRIKSAPDFLDVSEEVAHVRVVHEQNVAVYDAVFENQDQLGDKRDEALRLAGSLLNSSADDVIRAVEKAARIQVAMVDKVSPFALEATVRQISQFVFRAFDMPDIQPGDDIETQKLKVEAKLRLQKFNRMMSDELCLPTMKSLGTTITPDQQVLAMDASIPSGPDDGKEIED